MRDLKVHDINWTTLVAELRGGRLVRLVNDPNIIANFMSCVLRARRGAWRNRVYLAEFHFDCFFVLGVLTTGK